MNWQDAEREYDDAVIGTSTIPELFADSAERHTDRPAQRYKPGIYDRSMAGSAYPTVSGGEYGTLTYGEAREIVAALAAGFRDLGIEPGDRAAIFADTRIEWAHADLGLLWNGAVVTTIYPESKGERLAHLLSDPGATAVVAGTSDQAQRALDAADLDAVVVMNALEGDLRDHPDVHTLGGIYDRGRNRVDEAEAYLDDRESADTAGIIYTSGTTGVPKGVELAHEHVRANVNQVRRRFAPRPDRGPDVDSFDVGSRLLAFLPLAHVYARLVDHFFALGSGACVCYAEDADTLAEDLELFEPNILIGVPLVYERLFDRFQEKVEGLPFGERLFAAASESALEAGYGEGGGLRHRLLDATLFSRFREALGGELDFFVSGGGSLPADLCARFHGMGLPIYEGYGLTEAAPVVTLNPPESPRIGSIGLPLTGVDVRIDTDRIPGDDFSDADGEVGELLVNGPNVFEGYWNDPEATEAAFTEDGFFRTGDLVELNDDGYIVFRERLRELLVLSTGKNVAPGPIEEALTSLNAIEGAMVVGDDRKFVAALIVPDGDRLRSLARRRGIDLPGDLAELADHPEAKSLILDSIEGINDDLPPHERVRDIELVPEPFTQEAGLLTPTMKKRRNAIASEYADLIERIYED